jgi:CubicO group peptidase (beta-lactamase class C family)
MKSRATQRPATSLLLALVLAQWSSLAACSEEAAIPEVSFEGPESIGSYLNAYIEAPGGPPSISIAVGVDGEIVLAAASGVANIADGTPATPETPYRTYSISKGITAVAVMQLVEKGELSLDDDIRDFLPEFPEKRWPVRLSHLMTHTSGIRHYKENAGEISSTVEYPTLAESLVVFKDDPLGFEPGSAYRYTSFGFNLLTGAIEGSTGKGFGECLDESIFGPAGMERSGLDVAASPVPGMAGLYGLWMGRHRQFEEPSNLSGKYGSSGVVSTPTDLVKLFLALDRGELPEPATLALMISEPDPETAPSQALGWNVTTDKGRRIVYRTGGGSGATGIVEYFPDHGITGAVLINMGPYKGRVPVLEQVLEYYLERPPAG